MWLDPQRARLMVKAIAEELARTDSEHARAHRERAATLDGELEALDKSLEAKMQPLKGQAVASTHDSFGYFAERYGLRFVPLRVSCGQEKAEDARAQIEREKVRVLFLERGCIAPWTRGIASHPGQSVAVHATALDPIGSQPTARYEDTLNTNADTLLKSLQHQQNEPK